MSAVDPALGPATRGITNDRQFVVLLKVLFHTGLLLVMPFLVGGVTGLFADVSQVGETVGALVRTSAALMFPVLVAQLAGIVVKVRRELKAARADGPLPQGAVLQAVYRHVRVMTDKGLSLFIGSLILVSMSLSLKLAELGIMAVLGLSTLYVLVAVGIVLSTFVVSRFEERLATRGGSIGREFSPVVVESGESVEEMFHFERVPVPPGFNLRVQQQLPARLATESRHAVGSAVSMQRVTLSRPLRRTPRGEYHIAPADIVYTDLFGLTRVSVAQAAGAQLKVLPRLHPVVIEEAPRALAPEEGSLSILRKMPSDDWFRVRDYGPGDDTRRLHWKLSVKLGRLQVRLPETVPVVPRKVMLVLDNHAPAAHAAGVEADLVLGDALDRLVEIWLSLARALEERGEDVTLVLPTGDRAKPFDTVRAKRGMQSRLRDIGSRVRWQSITDLHHAVTMLEVKQSMVVVTARFVPLPELPAPMGSAMTWVFLPVAHEIPGPVPATGHLHWRDVLLQRFAPGSEENGLWVAWRRHRARQALEHARRAMQVWTTDGSSQCEAWLRARGEAFYKVRRSGAAYTLVR